MSSSNAARDAAIFEALVPNLMQLIFQCGEPELIRDLTKGQLRVLRQIEQSPNGAVKLGELLGLTPSAISQVSTKLVHLGLVEKDDEDEDRRHKTLRLTSRGEKLMAERRAKRIAAGSEALSRLTDEERTTMISLLQKLYREAASVAPANCEEADDALHNTA